ncbi:MAG TPA: hypothetical protein VFA94_13525 [Acidimicrobiales bacterium]|nr:hypothetical protein [Acidimicrobiales bacterium]
MRYLVVANRTLLGEHLTERLVQCVREGPSTFHLLVPASHTPDGLVYTRGAAHADAESRLTRAVAALHQRGMEATGEVGDPDPVSAVRDVLNRGEEFDEIILSTFPPGPSRWLHQDVLHRLSKIGMPVTHVTADRVPVG